METTNATTTAQDTTNAEVKTDVNAPVANAGAETTQTNATPTETKEPAKELELKLPENSLLKPETVEQIKTYAKDKNLSLEVAQELLNKQHEQVDSFYKSQQQLVEQTKIAWAEESKKDPEIGGDNFGQNLELAKRALEKFSTPKFIEEIDKSGYGNHPEVIRVFMRIGKMLAEDKMVMANTHGGKQAKSFEEIFYGQQT
jgi:hypothetical protein